MRVVDLGPPVVGDPADLGVRHEHALEAHRAGQVGRLVEHVAAADEVLGARRVEDRAAVDLGRHRERDPAREVGLDQARDHVDRRPLRREHHVDAGGARLLGEADDRVLDVLALAHHQVGELVDHDHDVRQPVRGVDAASR